MPSYRDGHADFPEFAVQRMCNLSTAIANEAARDKSLETAKNLLLNGKLNYEEIAEATGLTVDEVKELDEKGVSEVCKQMEDLRNESLFEGKILTLIDLVEDDSLSIEKAAAKMNMTVNEFREFMNKAPLPL